MYAVLVVVNGDCQERMVSDAICQGSSVSDNDRPKEDESLVLSLVEWKAREGLSAREVDKQSTEAGFRLNYTRVTQYENDEWKELSPRERRRIRGFMGLLPAKQSQTYNEGVRFAIGKIESRLDELRALASTEPTSDISGELEEMIEKDPFQRKNIPAKRRKKKGRGEN